ncbi:endolytic transglycosylase MltG [Paludifilum halophilum]|uniref:Endolytic murein transglycosylase n=1 Tax=Paludifilum halophilum TaxID=1642702 RepID=A0A235B955_9BACL|nr:endolytic transglycosylase MltG [Paludifilum halophilum]OYD08840.1 hypothetical protein CHM34_03365 [Paludifilum halophilum]
MKWLFRLLLILLLFSGFSVGGYWYMNHMLTAPTSDEPVELEVASGSSILEVGRLLEQKDLIHNQFLFATYGFLHGKAKGLKAGVYVIPRDSSAKDILDILSEGKENVMRLTVPEGFTVKRIADRLEKKGVDRKEFLRAVNRQTYSQYPFAKKIPVDSKRRYRLEGYLYPTTYNVPKGTRPEVLVDKMLGQFQKRLQKNDVKEKLKERNLTVNEWVTIASIVEREGLVRDELPRIAGVIDNRLEIGKKLQVDATVLYALGEQKERVYFKDLKVKSPYNTYRIQGLPPGPIANPGKDALQAVLEPEEHDYLFYVTRKDGSGRHYFARTEAQHKRNIARSEREAAQSDD